MEARLFVMAVTVMLIEASVEADVSGRHNETCRENVRKSWFHDIPSSAMRVEGNDHLILSNLVENVVKESDDQGGSDTWGDPRLHAAAEGRGGRSASE